MQDSYYLRAIARGVGSLIAAIVLGLVGVALIQVGIVPGFGVDGLEYELSALGWVGVGCAIGAVVALIVGVSLVREDVARGDVQLEMAKAAESDARVAAVKARAAERDSK